MQDNTRLYRIVKMITLLEGAHKKWTAADLAEYFRISERTFHRDREILERIIPLYYDNGKKTYKVLNTKSFNPPVLSREEAVALALAARAFQVENFPYQKDLDMALSKVMNSLPESVREVLHTLDNKIVALDNPSVDLRDYQQDINLLNKAIENTNKIKMEYSSLQGEERLIREVDPYNLIFKSGACYLVGYCHLREAIRTFRIDRIHSFQVLDELFERPENYSPEEYFRYSWGIERGQEFEVELIFKAPAAQIVKEYIWHETQEIKELSAGKILFKVRTCSSNEIKRWIMSFGSRVEVIKPEWLKKEIKEELEEALKNY